MRSGTGGRSASAGLWAAAASLFLVGVALVAAAPASGSIPSVFDGEVSCSVQPNGSRFCGSTNPRSTARTFDDVPLDVNVAFPPSPASGPDGNFPLMMGFSGYGFGKLGGDWMQNWAGRGYAVFSLTYRGFHESCGTESARSAAPEACEDGYIRLMDTRYEVRDAQYLAGRLVDQGLVAPRKIAAMGTSYGGGLTLALAALRDRVVLPDGSLAEWRSAHGTAMELAAAHPVVAWSDFASVFLENASTLDYLADSPYAGRPGVERAALLRNLAAACSTGYCAPQGADPDADIRSWRERLDAGEPYDDDPAVLEIIEELSAHHSPYAIPTDRPPAPSLIVGGFTDDVIPVSETLRFYNRAMSEFPDAPLALGDYGHARAQIPAYADLTRGGRIAWMDLYVRGQGPVPHQGVVAHTQSCPAVEPAAQTLRAGDIAILAPGEVRLQSAATQAVEPGGGDAAITSALNPFTAGAACNAVPGADQAGVASYRLAAAPAGGYTLAGSPTVIADVASPEPNSQLAARLLDVAPNGQATLVSRAVWRPPASPTPVRSVFQL